MCLRARASPFSARVAASPGASLSACALAGLSTLSGPLHGAAVSGVLAFLGEAHLLGAGGAIRARLHEGRALPGSGPGAETPAEVPAGQHVRGWWMAGAVTTRR